MNSATTKHTLVCSLLRLLSRKLFILIYFIQLFCIIWFCCIQRNRFCRLNVSRLKVYSQLKLILTNASWTCTPSVIEVIPRKCLKWNTRKSKSCDVPLFLLLFSVICSAFPSFFKSSLAISVRRVGPCVFLQIVPTSFGFFVLLVYFPTVFIV